MLMTLVVAGLILQVAAPASAIMLVSRDDEVRIGRQVEARAIEEYGLTTDAKLASRVEAVGKKVAAVSPRQNVTYTYKVLKSDTINAFAAPGGPVMITEELAKMLTDDELAFVLAHETGHIAAQHGRNAINRALIAQGVFSVLFRRAGDVTKTGVNIVYTLYDRGYSRDQEYEADRYGVQLMKAAGYNSEGAITALAKPDFTIEFPG